MLKATVYIKKTVYIYTSYNTITLSIKLLTGDGRNNMYIKKKGRFTTTLGDFTTPQEVVNSQSDPARSVEESRVYIFVNVMGCAKKM